MGIGSNQSRRTPVPLCGGGHSETYILEHMLDEGIKPKRTKWPSSSYVTPQPKPQPTKGGMNVVPIRPDRQ